MGVPNIENLKPAPRKIPFLLKLQLIFGGDMNQTLWLVIGLYALYAWTTWDYWFIADLIIYFIFLVTSIVKGNKQIKSLQNGVLGYGELIEVQEKELKDDYSYIYQVLGMTRERTTKKYSYTLVFKYQGLNKLAYKLKIEPDNDESLQDEKLEQLIYDPKNPFNVVMLDNIPGGIHINIMGDIRYKNPLVSLGCLILPLYAIVIQFVEYYILSINDLLPF